MESKSLYAPWRMQYIRSIDRAESACFLCEAAGAGSEAEKRDRLVLWHSAHCLVVINRFPYTNGHLLVAPLAHVADLEELDEAQLLDMQRQTVAAIALLKRAISPQGFNVGLNLGRCAGAGVPGHIHQHIVPRWNGDTNFMSVVADVRVVPEAAAQLYGELKKIIGDQGNPDSTAGGKK